MKNASRANVVIVGGGFAGIAAAKALAAAPVELTVVDRRNHHVFQPLLYQVATASLSPAEISSPIRAILRGQKNCQVALAEVLGVEQGGIQMGRYAGRLIADEVSGRSHSASRAAFSYADKGSMAVIGKAKAVAQIGRFHLTGFLGWLAWGGIHIVFLIGFRHRLRVLLSWFWNWLLNSRDARIITGNAGLVIRVPRSADFVHNDHAPVPPAERSAEPSEG